MTDPRRGGGQRAMPPVPARELEQFVAIVRRLRRECPWDRKQTHASLRSALIEETYEVVDAITRRRPDELQGELGDLLLHVVLQATIAEQAREFTLREVLDAVTDKMIRRHPHVFGHTEARTAGKVKENWERIKMTEGRTSALEGVPRALPALLRARRVQERASGVGFDWRRPEDVWVKVREEVEELRRALDAPGRGHREEEFGDLLFSLVNYARFLRIDPEHALQRSTEKFSRRFKGVEGELRRRGRDPRRSSLEEMDAIWNDGKKRSRRRSRRA